MKSQKCFQCKKDLSKNLASTIYLSHRYGCGDAPRYVIIYFCLDCFELFGGPIERFKYYHRCNHVDWNHDNEVFFASSLGNFCSSCFRKQFGDYWHNSLRLMKHEYLWTN